MFSSVVWTEEESNTTCAFSWIPAASDKCSVRREAVKLQGCWKIKLQRLSFLILKEKLLFIPTFETPPPCLIQWRKNKRRAHSLLSAAASRRAQESRFDVATSLNCAPKRIIMSYVPRFIPRCQANSNSFWILLGDTYIMSTKFCNLSTHLLNSSASLEPWFSRPPQMSYVHVPKKSLFWLLQTDLLAPSGLKFVQQPLH